MSANNLYMYIIFSKPDKNPYLSVYRYSTVKMSHEFTYWRCIPHAFSGRILRRMHFRVTYVYHFRCPYCRAAEFEVIYPSGNIASNICTTVNKKCLHICSNRPQTLSLDLAETITEPWACAIQSIFDIRIHTRHRVS